MDHGAARHRSGGGLLLSGAGLPGIPLSDGLVTLSPLTPEDVAAHLAGEDGELIRWYQGGPNELVRTTEYFRMCAEQWALPDGEPLAFGIRTGDPLTLAGTIDLRSRQPDLAPGQVNIAYGLYPAFRGRALATRAVALACDFSAALGHTEAVIKVAPENAASVAVAERAAGFEHVRTGPDDEGTVMQVFVRRLAT